VVSLDGLTVVPGFVDAHQHRIGDGPGRLGVDGPTLIEAAIAQGFTTIDELYVDEGRLEELIALDQAGLLRLRVNAYLPVNENSPDGRLFGDYYTRFQPGQMVSPRVRVAGLKVFTDFDNANVLLWEQGELNSFVADSHRAGWPLAIKSVSTTSLNMILEAVDAARGAQPEIVDARTRLEHMLFATPDQIDSIRRLGMVPAINTNVPGQLVGEPDIEELVAREPVGAYAPWRNLFEAGIPTAGISGFPSFYVDEPNGAPFGSAIHLIYQAVTRAGNLGVQSPEHLLDQALTAEQALAAHTINGAFAAQEEDVTGSLVSGKRADLVILSASPLDVSPEEINEIEVVMTMIGGRVEFCAAGAHDMCPDDAATSTTQPPAITTRGQENVALGASVIASSELPDAEAGRSIDGTDAHWNAARATPQWIELTLRAPSQVESIRLVVAQDPPGPSVHELWVRSDGELVLMHVFEGVTEDGEVLTYEPAEPLREVDLVRVVTTELEGLFPAWREIEVLGSAG
jgi:predicted amidohydrolase YtcJ